MYKQDNEDRSREGAVTYNSYNNYNKPNERKHCLGSRGSAGGGAAYTRQKANEREQDGALHVAQLRRNTHAEIRLRYSQRRQWQRSMRRQMQRCRLSILLLTLLLPRLIDALARSINHLLRCVAPANVWKLTAYPEGRAESTPNSTAASAS
jgi:hypothetical protein